MAQKTQNEIIVPYLEIPIPIECSLKCDYCFHTEKWRLENDAPDKVSEKYRSECPFTLAQFKAWRDEHLKDASEFLVELHGGEMSHPKCQPIVLDILDDLGKSKFQLQTNGLGDVNFYKEVIKRKDVIDRIGFTYHRKSIEALRKKDDAICAFTDAVMLFKEAGFKIYVKEILFPQYKDKILKHKKYWEGHKVEFRIQDFKPLNGRDKAPYYSPEDIALIHPEYYHAGPGCACRVGHKNVIIRGYDWFAGDVIACWQDPTPVGNITDNWYNPNYVVTKKMTGELKVVVGSKDEPENSSKIVPTNKSETGGTMSSDNEVSVKLSRILTSKIDTYAQQLNLVEAKLNQYERDRNALTLQAHKLLGFIEGAKEIVEELQKPAPSTPTIC